MCRCRVSRRRGTSSGWLVERSSSFCVCEVLQPVTFDLLVNTAAGSEPSVTPDGQNDSQISVVMKFMRMNLNT